jgi:hypothetical protein
MKIRAGYEISYDCPQPTPMILTLSVHPFCNPTPPVKGGPFFKLPAREFDWRSQWSHKPPWGWL